MPLQMTGEVVLRIAGEQAEEVTVHGEELVLAQGGLRILDDEDVRHEFVYRYDRNPRFVLVVSATVTEGVVELDPPLIEHKAADDIEEQRNTLDATFEHDPDTDDEPLTPVSSN